MRGPATFPLRSGGKLPPGNDAVARAFSLPAPYNGWNARGNLANMSPLEAIQMDNFFPGVQDIELRKGSASFATAAPDNVKTLLAYHSTSASKLFAATDTDFYDVTAGGAFGASVTSCTEGLWHYVNFTNPAGSSYLVAANGVDDPKLYDGATWSTPAITGVTLTSLTYPLNHQKRLWFIEKDTMNVWYLAVESIAGAATKYPLGALFKQGGSIAAIGTWTVDSGNGSNDLFVIVTTNGEIAIYQGTDPSSSTTWALVGVFDSAQPLGAKPLIDYGGDLLYLSKTGLIPISKLSQSVVLERTSQISFRIDGAFLDAAEDFGTNSGWQMILHKAANALFVNVPIQNDEVSVQFIMNTVTKAWCRFVGWNASCWASLNGELYFAGGLTVSKAWTGTSDAGVPITGSIAQAYSSIGAYGQKQITLTRPHIGLTNSASISMAFDADFKTFGDKTDITYTPAFSSGVWDLSDWDAAYWDGNLSIFEPLWREVPGELGYLHSFRLRVSSAIARLSWTSTDFTYMSAGIL